jgi:hypothetical protein
MIHMIQELFGQTVMTTNEKPAGKVEITIGNLTFSAEGSEAWLSEQLAKVVDAAAKIPAATLQPHHGKPASSASTGGSGSTDSLATYLKAKGGDTKQLLRFLATAAWLRRRDNAVELTSGAVAKALTAHQQKGLANPADCLNKNVQKGFCEKTNSGFFITPEGWNSLGEAQP